MLPSCRLLVSLSTLIKIQVNKKLGTHAVVFRNDLLDCRIAVCSNGVLQSFEDNFDYTLISQFICGVVNEEILGAQVHAYVAKGMTRRSLLQSNLPR